ncbi:uncharacterized protein LY89DRAFT_724626 [Mollisia scopiformis]|uniref:Uncharacterized protein n=1 Tax=Mollisia scopiformis TaxID=149040 RepID=A0A132BA31_MOLSC|nr:uncharacterized protein LY89DRAFT_724626 [Mollisia scopiformis]KUJ09103.1 hypothetical protein LY89DRAFT_724626 [Mollisia scopiformis]
MLPVEIGTFWLVAEAAPHPARLDSRINLDIAQNLCTMIRDATTADTTRSPSRTKLTIDTILRSLGLAVFQSSKDGGRKKTALDKSRSQALSRCAVHIIPIIGAIVIISLNFKALYIGATLNAITALQFAAKLHEITMVASIACIVFSYLRYQLTLGDGLPLGATIAGLELTRISYLWSLGFWGALMSPNFSLKQKVQFVLVVVPAIVLVATVGPSSAVCMIPRTSYWPAGSTDIWINGTYDELYSTFVDASGVPSTCANTSIAAGLDGCPSNSWQGLLNYIPFFNATLGPPNSNWISTTTFGVDFLTIPISVGLAGVHSIRSLYITVDDVNQGGSSDPLATIQPAPLADALVLVGSMWATLNATLYGRWSSRLDSIHTMEILQPFVGMTCNWQEVPIEGNSDARTVTFPQGMYMNTTVGYIDYDGISRSDLWNTPGDISKPRLAFVDLPDPQFSNVSVGVVILEPRNPANNTQAIIPCILAAGWGQSKMILSTGNNLQRGTAAVQSTSFVEPFQESYPTNYCFPSFPLIHINITKDWAAYMNPFLPLQNTTVFGALSSLMNNGEISTGTKQEKVNEEGIYTFLITSLLANALSNNSPSLSIQGNITVTPSGRANGNSWLFHNANMFTIPSSPQTANWTKLRIDSFVQGLSLLRVCSGAFGVLRWCFRSQFFCLGYDC